MSPSSDRKALWLRGALDLCVLALLDRGERYGYEISQALDEAGLGRIKGGTLYPLLGRLAEAGYVTSEWRAGEHGPGRKYYTLTELGRALLIEGTASWKRFARATAALLDDQGGDR